jgi:hypothetical protein
MRFIVTSDTLVEKFKQEAKKVKRKHGGTHADALDRVARQHGYNHWNHVKQCAKQTAFQGMTVAAACEDYIERAQAKKLKFEVKELNPDDQPLILFSTLDGDAWIVAPSARRALCLCWQGERQEFKIEEDSKGIAVGWDADYQPAEGYGFSVDSQNPKIGKRVILGYPIEEIEDIGDHFRISPAMRHLFLGEGTEPLTDELVAELVSKGWPMERLIEARENGMAYSRPRNSIIGAPMTDLDP